jgi:MFS family permease
LAGVVLITIVPLNILLQRNNPQEIGQNVDGARAEELGENVSPETGQTKTSEESLPKIWTIHSSLRSEQFWFLFFAFVFTPLAVQGTLIHQVASVVDRGFTAIQGAFFFGLAGIMGSAGKIFFGWLSDKIGRGKAFGIGLGCAFLGVVSLMQLSLSCPYLLYGYAILFGLGYGSSAPIFPSRAADLFMGPHFGKILGVLSIALGIGGAFGVWLSGKIYDVTTNYNASFIIVLISFILAIILFQMSGVRVMRKTAPAGSLSD